MEFKHTSILLNEVIESLAIKPDGIYADGTLGGGGHSHEIASKLRNGILVGIDQDEDAIRAAGERLADFCPVYTGEGTSGEPFAEQYNQAQDEEIQNSQSKNEQNQNERIQSSRVQSEQNQNERIQSSRVQSEQNQNERIQNSQVRGERNRNEMQAESGKNVPKVRIVRDNYRNMKKVLADIGIDGVDGILLDLGVSSFQFDSAERGFSYRFDAPLDMRMDRRQQLSAYEIVNNYPEAELFRIIRDYGEEKFAKNIAKHIAARRSEKPIETTFELNEVIKESIPAKMRAGKGHPSKQTFQAIRIECNRELEVLQEALADMISLLKPDGRLAIITFHSLEDRMVKNVFKTAQNPCICPPDFPVCVCGRKPLGETLTRKPIVPTQEEMAENPRAKSAKLRVFVRNEEPFRNYFEDGKPGYRN